MHTAFRHVPEGPEWLAITSKSVQMRWAFWAALININSGNGKKAVFREFSFDRKEIEERQCICITRTNAVAELRTQQTTANTMRFHALDIAK